MDEDNKRTNKIDSTLAIQANRLINKMSKHSDAEYINLWKSALDMATDEKEGSNERVKEVYKFLRSEYEDYIKQFPEEQENISAQSLGIKYNKRSKWLAEGRDHHHARSISDIRKDPVRWDKLIKLLIGLGLSMAAVASLLLGLRGVGRRYEAENSGKKEDLTTEVRDFDRDFDGDFYPAPEEENIVIGEAPNLGDIITGRRPAGSNVTVEDTQVEVQEQEEEEKIPFLSEVEVVCRPGSNQLTSESLLEMSSATVAEFKQLYEYIGVDLPSVVNPKILAALACVENSAYISDDANIGELPKAERENYVVGMTQIRFRTIKEAKKQADRLINLFYASCEGVSDEVKDERMNYYKNSFLSKFEGLDEYDIQELVAKDPEYAGFASALVLIAKNREHSDTYHNNPYIVLASYNKGAGEYYDHIDDSSVGNESIKLIHIGEDGSMTIDFKKANAVLSHVRYDNNPSEYERFMAGLTYAAEIIGGVANFEAYVENNEDYKVYGYTGDFVNDICKYKGNVNSEYLESCLWALGEKGYGNKIIPKSGPIDNIIDWVPGEG